MSIMSTEDLGPKEWFRCNKCYMLMRESKAPFFLSYCGHIFCPKCVKTVAKKCPQCNAQNLRTMPLVEPLSPEVQHCFESVEELNEKFSQAITFQTQQLTINSKRFSAIDKKYGCAKVEYQRSNNAFKRSQKRIKELESELELMRRKVCEFENSHKKLHYLQNSSSILTPQSYVSSVNSLRSARSGKSFNNSILTPITPTKLEQMDFMNSEFRIPSITRVPRSVGSSSKNSCNSSMKTSFTDECSPFVRRR